MNKNDLVNSVVETTGIKKKDVEDVIKATFDNIAKAMTDGDKVQLIGFGTFEVRERAARIGKNPATGSEIKIEARKIPAFRAGKALKDAIK